jgi:hypothetical protein
LPLDQLAAGIRRRAAVGRPGIDELHAEAKT